jgi:hypothetical protein
MRIDLTSNEISRDECNFLNAACVRGGKVTISHGREKPSYATGMNSRNMEMANSKYIIHVPRHHCCISAGIFIVGKT